MGSSIVSLKQASRIVMVEKCLFSDMVQVSIQLLFLYDVDTPNNFMVMLSVLFGMANIGMNMADVGWSIYMAYHSTSMTEKFLESKIGEMKEYGQNPGAITDMRSSKGSSHAGGGSSNGGSVPPDSPQAGKVA